MAAPAQNRRDPIKPTPGRTAKLERGTLLPPWSTTACIRLILLFGAAFGFRLGRSGRFGIFRPSGIRRFFVAGRARARLFFGGLFVAIAPIIGDIKTGPFE